MLKYISGKWKTVTNVSNISWLYVNYIYLFKKKERYNKERLSEKQIIDVKKRERQKK